MGRFCQGCEDVTDVNSSSGYHTNYSSVHPAFDKKNQLQAVDSGTKASFRGKKMLCETWQRICKNACQTCTTC